MKQLSLDLHDIQGDILTGLPKNYERFIFYKITNAAAFGRSLKEKIVQEIINTQQVREWELAVRTRKSLSYRSSDTFLGLNLGFTNAGIAQLVRVRPTLDPPFEKGADHRDTIKKLNDPLPAHWLKEFTSDRIDGILLVTSGDRSSLTSYSNQLLRGFASSIKVVYSEIGNTRPFAARGHEHFGFLDGVSQPRIRGLTSASDPKRRPDQGLPGQDLIWPGEFVFGYPGQHPEDPHKAGPQPPMAAAWMHNGSYMVFRRLEQMVPEFRRFVREQAARLGMDPELLAARMVGRWKSGAPMELAPRRDALKLGADQKRNNDFEFGDDPEQRRCPYAAHIRKVYSRDEGPGGEAEAQRHRIIRAGIPFGPEVEPGETVTRHSRGLMFVCYQTSIERQFEFLQRRANDPGFIPGKRRPGSGMAVTPGYDPIIGQAPGNGARRMDEPYPNYPAGSRRTTLEIPREFVKLTAAAYFFMPSISALRTVLT